MASTLTMAKAVSITDYKPTFRVAADKRTWEHEKISNVGTTKRGQEKYFGFVGLPLAEQRGELEPVKYFDIQELGETTLTVVKFLLGTRFSYELIEDNQHLPNLMREGAKMLSESFGQIYDKYRALCYDRAFATTYQTVHDGKALCATDHPLYDGTTYSNVLTTSAPDYDALWSALATYEWTRKNHAGLLATDKAKAIVCHPSKIPDWTKILENSVQPDTIERNDSFVKRYNLDLIPDPWQASTTAWFIVGDEWKERNIVLWRKRFASDEPFDDKTARAIMIPAEMRFAQGVTDYLPILGNQGS